MAKAYECDACGDLFKTGKVLEVFMRYDCRETHWDFCPNCQKEFENWLKRKEGRKK